MGSGTLDLTINDHSFEFAPASEDCPSCTARAAYDHSVDIATTGEQTTIEVEFICTDCETAVETVTRTVTAPGGGAEDTQTVTDDHQAIYDWIVAYADEEGRHPTKSKCVREVSFEIFKAQRLLDELVEEGELQKEEELRAGAPIEVFKPVSE